MNIIKNVASWVGVLLIVAAFLGFELLLSGRESQPGVAQMQDAASPTMAATEAATEAATVAATIITLTPTDLVETSTPEPTLAPTNTLRPPPTIEPPTATPQPSQTPLPTATATLMALVDVPGLHGLDTATPTSTPGCTPRKDWTLTYTVQNGDALDNIAAAYGTNRWDLVEGNCLTDANMIRVGQELRVPGDAHPAAAAYECTQWQVLTPMNYAQDIDPDGSLTFNWIGPAGERNLIRVYMPDGEIWEAVVDLRQNITVDLREELPDEGTYYWQVFPLDLYYVQIPCSESPQWSFYKGESTEITETQGGM